jgi:hypothetical protein
MSMRTGLARLSLPVVLLLAAAGCGSDDLALVPVRGRVLYKGVPVPGGSIVFTPDADKGGHGPLARGEIRPDGTYTLTTDGQPGATPGWHRVTVVSVEAVPGKPAGTGFADVQSLLPRHYASPDLSGLDRQVKPGEENVIDFHLD